MATTFTYLPHKVTGHFSRLVLDYLDEAGALGSFYRYRPTQSGITAAINERKNFPVNRKALVDVLQKQYSCFANKHQTEENILSLLDENTFTVCTAHQPNLLTGYLYFVYKIIHAIKLTEDLNRLHADKHFVPVYYMGSEDNDLEELGTFQFSGKKYTWDGAGQTGAVGRMKTTGLKSILDDIYHFFGPPGVICDNLVNILNAAYLKHETIAQATQYLVHELFGHYGLVVIDPDDAALKRLFIPVMKDELLQQQAYNIVNNRIREMEHHYPVQAKPRHINLFYLNDQLRERIEQKNDKWAVVNTSIEWTKDELLNELNDHPERFSPNVMLRGLYQETILPDVAFIGGGAEVSYWLQLNTLFHHYGVFYPVVLLRQSILWVDEQQKKKVLKTGSNIEELFLGEDDLIKQYITQHINEKWKLDEERQQLENVFEMMKVKATSADATLKQSADAVFTKINYQIAVLEKKILRAEKRKHETQITRIVNLKNELFPNNSLQERVDNFLKYYLEMGAAYFDTIKGGILPLENKFLIIEQ